MKFIRHTIILLLLSSGTCLADSDASSDISPYVLRQSLEELVSFRCKGMEGVDYFVYFRASERGVNDRRANAGDASQALRSRGNVSIETQGENCTDITQIMKDSVDEDPQGITPHVVNAAHALVSKRETGETDSQWEFIPDQNRHVFIREAMHSGAFKSVMAQTVITSAVALTAWLIGANPYLLVLLASMPVISHVYTYVQPSVEKAGTPVVTGILTVVRFMAAQVSKRVPDFVWTKLGYEITKKVAESVVGGTTSHDPAFDALKNE